MNFRGGGAEHKFSLKGFTLAEVLITLGIIGVVAAMTMPVLIQKYKFLTYEVGLKKQYSNIQNTLNYLNVENGISLCFASYPVSPSYVFEARDCAALEEALVSSLKLKKYNSNIKDKYARKDAVLSAGGSTINVACSYDYVIHIADVYATQDGALIMLALGEKKAFIIIDVNGEKEPNKWGYDVFFMTLSSGNHRGSTGKILLTDEFCSISEKGGRYARTILRNEKDNVSNTWFYN